MVSFSKAALLCKGTLNLCTLQNEFICTIGKICQTRNRQKYKFFIDFSLKSFGNGNIPKFSGLFLPQLQFVHA